MCGFPFPSPTCCLADRNESSLIQKNWSLDFPTLYIVLTNNMNSLCANAQPSHPTSSALPQIRGKHSKRDARFHSFLNLTVSKETVLQRVNSRTSQGGLILLLKTFANHWPKRIRYLLPLISLYNYLYHRVLRDEKIVNTMLY